MEYKVLNADAVNALLPERLPDTHKGHYGKILLLCGSVGLTGAAALAAMGALRVGAGLVYLGVPQSIYEIEAIKLTEPIVFPLPDDKGKFSAKAIDTLHDINKYDAVLIGPGIGSSTGTYEMTRYVLEEFNGPVVIDADGINVLSAHTHILRGRHYPTILTPHDGEFIRLGGQAGNDRVAELTALAQNLGVIILRKGHRTIISDGTQVYVNHTGNPGMAVGGCGDVLAGMVIGLLGQGMAPMVAAAVAAWLHGMAGDICADRIGQYGMLPSDMLEVLPRLLK